MQSLKCNLIIVELYKNITHCLMEDIALILMSNFQTHFIDNFHK